MKNHLFESNLRRCFQESQRSIPDSSSGVSDVPIQAKILTSSLRRRNERSLSVFTLRFSSQFTRVRGNMFPYDLLEDPCCLYLSKDMQIRKNFTMISQPLYLKEPAYLTKYSFAFGLNDVKSDISYHGLCKI